MKLLLTLVFSLLHCWWNPVTSAEASSQEREVGTDVYRIVGAPSGRIEHLPASYVDTFPKWQISQSGQSIPISSEEECTVGGESKETTISVQPTINFLLKGGAPTYLFAGLWVKRGLEDKQISGRHHHLAQQWTTFDQAAKPNFHVEIFMGQGNGSDNRRLGLVEPHRLREAVEQLGIVLATSHEDDLASGFQILSIPLKMDAMDQLDMARGKGGTMMLTCLATAQQDGLKLLSLDKSEADNIPTSKLEVEAFKVLSVV